MRADLTSPARDFLDHIKEGTWADDPESAEIPDDEQVKDYYALVHKIRYLGQHGEPERRGDVNYLRRGIWEFKHGSKRIAFYITDGRGREVLRGPVQEIGESPSPMSSAWWFPEPAPDEDIVRLANAWPKLGQKTEEIDMVEADTIREEDLEHDK